MKNNDWSDWGEKIRDTVQSAVDSKDFSQLNKTINTAVNAAIDSVRTNIKSNPNYESTNSPDYKQYPNREVSGNFRNANYGTVLSKQVDYDTTVFARRPAGSVAGPVMTSIGFTFFGIFGLPALPLFFSGLFATSARAGLLTAAGILGALGITSLIVGIKGIGFLGSVRRFRRYIQILGNRGYCELSELCSKTGRSRNYVVKDLKTMLKRGMFLQGHLDNQQTCLIATTEAYNQYLDSQRALEQQQTQQLTENDRTGAGQSEECQRILKEGNDYIKHIHECNDDIPGEEISAKLSRLEEIMRKIFEHVERNPQVAPELHKFMNYYLPTTTKLVDAYRDLDHQPVAGKNISEIKQEIENTLDTINDGFENLLDSFFQDTAWDISSDISVMKTMMAQEGLTKNDFTMGG